MDQAEERRQWDTAQDLHCAADTALNQLHLLPLWCCHRLQQDMYLDSPNLIKAEVVAHPVTAQKVKENCHG
jgi:hypothetical protein